MVGDLLALLAVPSVLLRRRGRPMAAMSWLMGLFFFPYLGLLVWVLLGRERLQRPLHRLARTRARLIAGRAPRRGEVGEAEFADLLPEGDDRIATSAGNLATLLVDGPAAFSSMEAAITGAEQTVEALFFIWRADATGTRLAQLLAARARAGVRVRVLVDGLGGLPFLARLAKPLREAGVEVATFLPLWPPWRNPAAHLRNHRKILVVDGRIAFTGGMNVANSYAMDWHDLMLRVEGPAAAHLREVLLDDWAFATGGDTDEISSPPGEPGGGAVAVVSSGPEFEDNAAHDLVFLAIARSRRRVWMMTPYFVPPAATHAALRTAARRGADVRLLLPEHSDVPLVTLASRAYLAPLQAAGVRVYAYRGRVLHGKSMLIDEDLVLIGSANTDVRSFRLNFETTCAVMDPGVAADLEAQFELDFAQSAEVDASSLTATPVLERLLESLAHLLSPLL